MHVFYKPDPGDPTAGRVLYTARGDPHLAPGASFIEIPDREFESLAGARVEAGQVVFHDIAALRDAALVRINRHFSALSLDPRGAVHAAKEAEARDYLAAGPGRPADHPFLAAEVGLTAPKAAQLVQVWLGLAAIRRDGLAQIEAARLAAEASLGAAQAPAEIDAIVAAVAPSR